MCGIAGRLGLRPLGTHVTEQVSVALAHRGPDGFEDYRIAVGNLSLDLFFSRLSIIDLSPRSMQPFSFDDSVLIFNGEIYNYREIREDLVKSGHQFRTSGDAEVLVHALREWGTGCLDRLKACGRLRGTTTETKNFGCRETDLVKSLYLYIVSKAS